MDTYAKKNNTSQLLAFSKATAGIKTGLPSTAVETPICKVSGAF